MQILKQRYKEHIIQSLRKQDMSKSIKKILAETVENKIKKQQLTSTVSVLNSLRSNNAEQLLKSSVTQSSLKGESKNVVVKFNSKLRNIKKANSGQSLNQFIPYRQEDTLQGRIKHTGNFISKQINKPYHPFRILCKKFGDILCAYQQSEKSSNSENQYELKQELHRKTIKDFCQFLAAGCIGIYRKWIIDYTGMEEKKYDKWLNSLVLNEIWTINEGYLLNQIIKFIKKTRIPLKIDLEGLISCVSTGHITPEDFCIDEQLQIQGNYLLSIYQMCHFTEKKKPSQMLKQLQIIKNCICLDIDNYHRLCEKGQIFEVNGDNIMGIVAYILSKNAPKISQISELLLFLKILYGEGIYYNMDTSSYMYSTIWGAIEYLESKKFKNYKEEKQQSTNSVDKALKDTSCVESFFSDTSSNNTRNQNNLSAS